MRSGLAYDHRACTLIGENLGQQSVTIGAADNVSAVNPRRRSSAMLCNFGIMPRLLGHQLTSCSASATVSRESFRIGSPGRR